MSSRGKKDYMAKKLRLALSTKNVETEERIYVKLPGRNEHVGHAMDEVMLSIFPAFVFKLIYTYM